MVLKRIFSLEAKKLSRCTQVSTCAGVVDAAGGTTWTVVVEVAAIGLECWIRYIKFRTHGCGNGPRQII